MPNVTKWLAVAQAVPNADEMPIAVFNEQVVQSNNVGEYTPEHLDDGSLVRDSAHQKTQRRMASRCTYGGFYRTGGRAPQARDLLEGVLAVVVQGALDGQGLTAGRSI